VNNRRIARACTLGTIGIVTAIALAGCAVNEIPAPGSSSELAGTIDATGSSAQAAAQEAWVAGFQIANPRTTVNYQPTGSGTGRENFLSGGIDFAGSDRAFTDEEVAAGAFGSCATDDIVEVPLYISPVAIAFNLEGISSLNLDAATIAGIFAGTIDTWNDPAIAEQNEGIVLPERAISPVHRSDPSGTQETFIAYLDATAPDVWTYGVSDEWPFSGGEAAQGNSGVVQAISSGEGAVGFADASQVGDLGQVHIGVEGEYVEQSSESASLLVQNSPLVEGRGDADLVFDIDPASATGGAYPIALVSYLIGCEQYEDPTTAELVKAYFTHVASAEGQSEAEVHAGNAPISDDLRAQIMDAISLIGAR
jgi:phosphate transport system substrate-binding protein